MPRRKPAVQYDDAIGVHGPTPLATPKRRRKAVDMSNPLNRDPVRSVIEEFPVQGHLTEAEAARLAECLREYPVRRAREERRTWQARDERKDLAAD